MSFQGKRILFISPNFFNYEKAIKNRLMALGAEVDFFDERPSNSILARGIIRVNSNFYKGKIESYYQKIQKQISNKSYDYFLLIKGESIPFSFLEKFKASNTKTLRIFYTYDTVKEYPKFKKLMPYFQKNISFEPSDAKKYSFLFRPLFYLDAYHDKGNVADFKNDIVFIGSAHTDRYTVGEKVRDVAKSIGLNTYFYYYVPSKMAYYLKKMFDKNLKKFDINKLNFKKLSHSEIASIYSSSFSVMDINKPFQFGLSMRTFETLASEKKLITTNSEIKNYPIYNPQNIMIIDRREIKLDKAFFQTEFQKLSNTELYKMSLDSWIEDVFTKSNIDYWDKVLTK